MKSLREILLASAAFALALTTSQATILIPDTAVPLLGTDFIVRPELVGLIIEDDLVPFSVSLGGGGTITGQIQERVVRETVAGTLDFYWRVLIDPTSAGNLGSFRLGEFITSTYDADWRTDDLGTVSFEYGYQFSALPGYLNFGFSSELDPTEGSSRFIFLHTDATAYDKSGLMDVATLGFGSISEAASTFAPANEIPETSVTASGLALFGFVLLGGRAIRRWHQSS